MARARMVTPIESKPSVNLSIIQVMADGLLMSIDDRQTAIIS